MASKSKDNKTEENTNTNIMGDSDEKEIVVSDSEEEKESVEKKEESVETESEKKKESVETESEKIKSLEYRSLAYLVTKDTVFSYLRLAEDLLANMLKLFCVQNRHIPPPRQAPNVYRHYHLINYVYRQALLEQIAHRHRFNLLFRRRNAAIRAIGDADELVDFIASCTESIIDEMTVKKGARCDGFVMFHLSIACIAELSCFYIANNHRNAVKKLALAWTTYFEDKVKEDFQARGGASRIIKRSALEGLYLDVFLERFIPLHCVPYTGEDVSSLFNSELSKSVCKRSMGKRVEDSKRTSLTEENVATLELKIASELCCSDESEYEATALKVHDRLGIVPHEEILKRDLQPNPPAESAPVPPDDRNTAAIAALALAAERKKAKKAGLGRHDPLAKSRLRRTDADVSGTSSVGDATEARRGDPVPNLNVLPQIDIANLNLNQTRDVTSSFSRTTARPDSSAQGARPKSRKK